MAEDLTPSEIRTRKFAKARRGYDRNDVSIFLDSVADRITSLEDELSSINARLNQLGITELPDLKAEMEDVGVEVQSVLDAAIAAAEGLRSRASSDATDMMREADRASRELRGDAWTAGTELLQQAESEARHLVGTASDDALFIRAEAEQDAKRLVAEARRQADEMVRSSREEGERIVVIAKAESEAMLEGAKQAAEKAQERARALENRRAELLSELEEAESAQRDAEASAAERTRRDDDGTVRVINGNDRTHWPEDDGTVRILPATPTVPEDTGATAVDAEVMAAEVEQLRSAVTKPEPPAAPPIAEEEEQVTPTPTSDEEPPQEVAEEPDVEESAAAPEAIPEEPEPVAEQVAVAPTKPEGPPVPLAEEQVEERVTVVDDPAVDELFARLRHPVEAQATAEAGEEEVEVTEEPPRPRLRVVPDAGAAEEFERRDRMLLPIENSGLRGLKRRIVELQNRVLEELRTSGGEWRLGRELVVDVMGNELDAVLAASYQAGHAAAAESLQAAEPEITGGPQHGAAETFTTDLHHDVQAVLERNDGGHRRLSSDVGRVFRGWRTEEAEQHVRLAARRAFNDGLLAGYERLGISAVEVVAPGRPCGQCGAGTGITWEPGSTIPEGVSIPPAGSGCAAMIAPVG